MSTMIRIPEGQPVHSCIIHYITGDPETAVDWKDAKHRALLVTDTLVVITRQEWDRIVAPDMPARETE